MKAIDKKYFKKLIGNLRREIYNLFPQVMEAHMKRFHSDKPEKRLVCNCVFKIDPDCKIHSGHNTFLKIPPPDKPFDIPLTLTDIAIREKKSAPPLHVEVAKALPLPVCPDCEGIMEIRQHPPKEIVKRVIPRLKFVWQYSCPACHCFYHIPHHDESVELAIGALSKYSSVWVFHVFGGGYVYVEIAGKKYKYRDKSPALAICEAIDRHSKQEQK